MNSQEGWIVMWVDDGFYSTLTEFILLIRGRKLDGSRRKVISRDWRNLFIPVKSVCGLGTTYAKIRPWSFLEPKISLDLVCTKLYCFRASVDCYHCLYIFSANPVRRSEELRGDQKNSQMKWSQLRGTKDINAFAEFVSLFVMEGGISGLWGNVAHVMFVKDYYIHSSNISKELPFTTDAQ